jgi:hypothetical protein
MTEPNRAAIPVICDRCRAEGLAGEDPFAAFGDLLDFAPVPRRQKRANGWDEEAQRAFIAALSLTGSQRAAARAVGLAAFGVKQLLDTPGSEEFAAAVDEAHAIAADERSRRLAEGVRAIAAEQSAWRPPDPPWAGAATRAGRSGPARALASSGPARLAAAHEMSQEERRAAIDRIMEGLIDPYLLRLSMEREARLAGQIVAADFYLRQVTFMEVLLDMVSGDGFRVLRDFRRDGFDLTQIAQTPVSRLLGAARREYWEAIGEPVGPEHPPRDRLEEHDGYSTEPLEFIWGGPPEYREEQERALEERHARDARAQVEWEAAARRDYERRRAASPLIDEEPGQAGQPRSSED